MNALTKIQQFLHCETPDAWVKNALDNQALLLLDHANCEKKAASTAVNLMFRYVGDFDMMNKMSRLAREELRHYEQVMAIMKARGVAYDQITPGRYAGELRKLVRTSEPGRYIDTLICGAIIEARSCERFKLLGEASDSLLDPELKKLYRELWASEAGHYLTFIQLAEQVAPAPIVAERWTYFLKEESTLIQKMPPGPRMHSSV